MVTTFRQLQMSVFKVELAVVDIEWWKYYFICIYIKKITKVSYGKCNFPCPLTIQAAMILVDFLKIRYIRDTSLSLFSGFFSCNICKLISILLILNDANWIYDICVVMLVEFWCVLRVCGGMYRIVCVGRACVECCQTDVCRQHWDDLPQTVRGPWSVRL